MQPFREDAEWLRKAERYAAVSPPTQPLHSGWRPPLTWAGRPHDSRFLAEGPWPEAAVAPHRSYPGYYYEGSAEPVYEQSLEPEAATESSEPRSAGCPSFVLGVAFAGLLVCIGLLVVHSSLSPFDISPDIEEDARERRLEVAPNAVGERLIPRRIGHPDIDERGNGKTTLRRRAQVRVAGRAANGGSARPPLTSAKTSPETKTPTTAMTTTRGEDDAHPRRAATDESCSRHVYTHCVRPRSEFFYSADRRACVPAAADTVHVCNRGSNRFSSFESCLTSCVNGHRASDRCYESTLFFPCARQDLVDVPWYFDGKKCVAWTFPQGTCLSVARRGVFRSSGECRRRCVLRTEPECAEIPPAGTCSPRQLRHPYFADMEARGGARCVNASRRTLQSRRCLIGSNQFATLAACHRACGGN
ncbi:hypothetical protein HPB49_024850 [Dermacentor silvarum]|uniref:Uncharacterized protein n=1 Tax=Dermacentor silvarum TaxID=543639 RepID=A0ACB8C616_DERSI|nr:hypothetical protein HPB49_024850 [Dermacentor silvarum]